MKQIYIIAVSIALLLGGCSTKNGAVSFAKVQKAAQRGNAREENQLGYMYQYGLGIPVDYEKAVYWYTKAAEHGFVQAKVNLGYMYAMGLGTFKDKKEALRLYKEAADELEPLGMIYLAQMYKTGDTVEKSYVKAYMWLNIADNYTQNIKNSKSKWIASGALQKLKEEMTPEQILEGERLSKEWLKSRRLYKSN